jgi:uncharacterized protein YqeY
MLESIKQDIINAMKSKEEVRKNILRLLLSECNLADVRGQKVNVENIAKKLIKSNLETLSICTDEDTIARLNTEISILEEYLPPKLTGEELVRVVSDYEDLILNTKNDGAAVGVVMSKLKSFTVQPDEVKNIVHGIRLQSES